MENSGLAVSFGSLQRFYNSVNPKGPTTKHGFDHDLDPFAELYVDRASHHKKICLWLMNPVKHKNDIELEQRKFSGHCLLSFD
jgi:hypothetical protein